MSPNSFYKTVLIVGPVFFLNSAIFMMRGAHDLCSGGGICPVYSKDQVFAYNYWYWTAAYFLGL